MPTWKDEPPEKPPISENTKKILNELRRRTGAPPFEHQTADTPLESDADKPGYHVRHINRGTYGDASKITEEAEELADAIEQGCRLMVLVELSDIYGAMQGFLEKHFPRFTMDDIKQMSDITRRAFINDHKD
jgi:hypothetical protein